MCTMYLSAQILNVVLYLHNIQTMHYDFLNYCLCIFMKQHPELTNLILNGIFKMFCKLLPQYLVNKVKSTKNI